MKRVGLAAVVMIFGACMALPQDSGVEQQIKKMEKQLRSELVKGQTSAFDRLTADDYFAIDPSGGVSDKQRSIQGLKDGSGKYTAIDVKDDKVRVYGNTAIYNALATVKGAFDGHEVRGDYRVTIVWVKQNGQWKRVSFQSTEVRPQRSE